MCRLTCVSSLSLSLRASLLLDQYRKKSKLYRSKVLLVPLGDDFRYDKALEWDQQYINYQKLFDYMNSHPEMHVQVRKNLSAVTVVSFFIFIFCTARSTRCPEYFCVQPLL